MGRQERCSCDKTSPFTLLLLKALALTHPEPSKPPHLRSRSWRYKSLIASTVGLLKAFPTFFPSSHLSLLTTFSTGPSSVRQAPFTTSSLLTSHRSLSGPQPSPPFPTTTSLSLSAGCPRHPFHPRQSLRQVNMIAVPFLVE
jgi:hypothetical protein